ncbi:MAG TPA: hypothetical protein VK422_21325 [Pyrinomonadaceae bacterium]|nr:hypothetical protein [Pyrinomonadaceae bacterium]
MSSIRKLRRAFVALSLVLALGATPSLAVWAQQPAQKQQAPKAERTAPAVKAVKVEKASAEEQDAPLSDAEMEKVEGGFPWLGAVAVAGLGVGLYSAYSSYRHDRRMRNVCRR